MVDDQIDLVLRYFPPRKTIDVVKGDVRAENGFYAVNYDPHFPYLGKVHVLILLGNPVENPVRMLGILLRNLLGTMLGTLL